MRSRKTILVALVHACCLLAAAVSISQFASEPAFSQRFGRDNDDRRDGDRPRPFGTFRRDRSERDRDDEDRDEERRDDAGSESKEEKSNDGPSLSAESFARGVMSRYDKNGDKWLEGDELTAAGSMTQAADADGDKKVTINELVAQASAKRPTTPAAAAKPTERAQTSSESAGKSNSTSASKSSTNSKRVYTWTGGGPAGEEKKAVRHTYRFSPAGERLPVGLPTWFKSQDKNGDGQVQMSEYSRTWSRSTVSRFRGIDTNDDGVITAKEAAAKK
jgi:hypothetical protein